MRAMDFINAIISPLGFGLLLGAVLCAWRRRLARFVLRAGIAAEIVCLVLTTPFGANALVEWQERRTPAPAACMAPQPSVIVLLSGGMRRDALDAADTDVLNGASLQRTLTAARLVKRTPGARLVIAGGGRDGRGVAQSTVLADLAQRLGVPAEAIRTENTSLTTWENASNVRALEPPLPSRIWLVTSALHMPRALLAFRTAGFEPCSYPSDFLTNTFEGVSDLLPSGNAVTNSEAALHEMVGEVVYRLRALRH